MTGIAEQLRQRQEQVVRLIEQKLRPSTLASSPQTATDWMRKPVPTRSQAQNDLSRPSAPSMPRP